MFFNILWSSKYPGWNYKAYHIDLLEHMAPPTAIHLLPSPPLARELPWRSSPDTDRLDDFQLTLLELTFFQFLRQ
ncbi:hypothetical protein IFM89_002406 [Coptis chinensis]|uniref:Uncharacterized protein n=1 Tax=Coptis chinensis TaxID=261450 RepID=A0A835IJ39_9MAGN|nr:hypothetical protein IFM89_002406 [Coptis chinensis]